MQAVGQDLVAPLCAIQVGRVGYKKSPQRSEGVYLANLKYIQFLQQFNRQPIPFWQRNIDVEITTLHDKIDGDGAFWGGF